MKKHRSSEERNTFIVVTTALITFLGSLLVALIDIIDPDPDEIVEELSCHWYSLSPMDLPTSSDPDGTLQLSVQETNEKRRFSLYFGSEVEGHLSLWNLSSLGFARRILPAPSADDEGASDEEAVDARSKASAGGPYRARLHRSNLDEESVVLVWSRYPQDQLKRSQFPCHTLFQLELAQKREDLGHEDWRYHQLKVAALD